MQRSFVVNFVAVVHAYLVQQGYYYCAEGYRLKAEDEVEALKHYRQCYEVMCNAGSTVQRRTECFLHIMALGIRHSM